MTYFNKTFLNVILPNGAIRFIDRIKNIFKLSTGQYITFDKLQNIFAKLSLIKQIFIYGDSLQSYLVAIVIPDKKQVLKEFSDQISDYEEFI